MLANDLLSGHDPDMRWVFPDDNDKEEAAARQAVISRIDAWWEHFVRRIDDLNAFLRGASEVDPGDWMAEKLHAIDPRLLLAIRMNMTKPGYRLVIMPDAEMQLRPLVDEMLRRAPAVEGWEFDAHRLPDDMEMAEATVAVRTGGSLVGAEFSAAIGEGNRVDLRVFSPDCASRNDREAWHTAFLGVQTLLGDAVMEAWIGQLDVAPLTARKRKGSTLPLSQVAERVQSLIEGIRRQLPDLSTVDPETGPDGNVTILEVTPETTDADEEDPAEQMDLLLASTSWMALWESTHGGGLFASERFSRNGDRFCYLKLEWVREIELQDVVDWRASIEDALQTALGAANCGLLLGGGLGGRYVYIELALRDVQRAIPIIRQVAEWKQVPMRSWLLFHDAQWRNEWVGLVPGAPTPPGIPF